MLVNVITWFFVITFVYRCLFLNKLERTKHRRTIFVLLIIIILNMSKSVHWTFFCRIKFIVAIKNEQMDFRFQHSRIWITRNNSFLSKPIINHCHIYKCVVHSTMLLSGFVEENWIYISSMILIDFQAAAIMQLFQNITQV